jgi:hypothetical protein
MPADAVSPELLRRIQRGLAGTSRTMIEQFLRYSGVPAGTGDTKGEITKRVIRYVTEGRLRADAVARAVVEFREFSNKAIFLYSIDRGRLGNLEDRLPRYVETWSKARIAEDPVATVVSYSCIDGTLARVSFAEQHKKPHFDFEAGRISTVPVVKVVVLDVETDTGFVTLRYDPPEQLNPHRGSRLGYYSYFVERAQELTRSPLTPFDISKALLSIDGGKLVRTPYGRARTDDGQIDLAATADYRTMDIYPAILPKIATKQSGRYIWLEDASEEELLRDVPTDISAAASMVRFTKDVVAPEVAYVLGKIRAHS